MGLPCREDLTASARSTKEKHPPTPHHVEIEFEECYPSREAFVQRLAMEPRVPMVEGMQFLSDKNPEAHYMLQARPFSLPCPSYILSPTLPYLIAVILRNLSPTIHYSPRKQNLLFNKRKSDYDIVSRCALIQKR